MILEMNNPIETERCRSGTYVAHTHVDGRLVIGEGETPYQARNNLLIAAADGWFDRLTREMEQEKVA